MNVIDRHDEPVKPVNCGCGGKAKVWVNNPQGIVICQNCGISTKWCDTEAEAITAWNRAMGFRGNTDKITVDMIHTRSYINCANCRHWNKEDGDCEEICKLCGSLDYCSWWEVDCE